jgi:hypothetical protein
MRRAPLTRGDGENLATRGPEVILKNIELSLPEFGFIVATRAALGAGIGLLTTGRLCRRSRQRVGAALLAVGALTTIPAAFLLFGQRTPGPKRTAAA